MSTALTPTEETQTEVVPLTSGQPVSWVINRKVWLGATTATAGTALTGVLMWALKEFAKIDVPAEVGAQIAFLIGSVLAIAVYLIQAYMVTEPPTLPPGERAMRELVDQGIISRAQADAALVQSRAAK